MRHTIGSYPTVTVGEAREAARLILKDIQLGLYAPVKADPETAPPTLSQMITLFIEICTKRMIARCPPLRSYSPGHSTEVLFRFIHSSVFTSQGSNVHATAC